MKKKEVELITERIAEQMLNKGHVKTLAITQEERGELIGFQDGNALRIHKSRDTVPWKKIIDLCIEKNLDLNYIVKGKIL